MKTEIKFGRVEHTVDGRIVEVFAGGRYIGELYREPEMDEWAASADLEAVGFEHAHGRTLAEAKRDIRERQAKREERNEGRIPPMDARGG